MTKKSWLVNVALPIEAESPAEAVDEYWRYVAELGSAELPAYVCPVDDELAMIPFVAGKPANQDPEEDDETGLDFDLPPVAHLMK